MQNKDSRKKFWPLPHPQKRNQSFDCGDFVIQRGKENHEIKQPCSILQNGPQGIDKQFSFKWPQFLKAEAYFLL